MAMTETEKPMKRTTLLTLIGLLALPALTRAVPVDPDAPDEIAAIFGYSGLPGDCQAH